MATEAAQPASMAPYEYDLLVIGGGSGGLACAKEAASLGQKVCLLDFVVPSPKDTTWGLGGTCVNVGCIPKKLMHQAGLLGESFSDARSFGWGLPEKEKITHDWEKLVTAIQDHIGSLNWGYRVALKEKDIKYVNAMGKFLDPHTVEATARNKTKTKITAERIVIAVGGRPKYPDVPGDKECCITSDDIFSLPNAPGKTLVIGASYIALECAGFLKALGYDVSLMARSIFLRGFDQDIAELIGADMKKHGVNIIRGFVPTAFKKDGEQTIVTYKDLESGMEHTDKFDTVLLAVGRDALTKDLGLEAAGVEYDTANGKIYAEDEQTNVDNIYAIGDVLHSRQELTPVAIKAGVRLARRLYAKKADKKAEIDTGGKAAVDQEAGKEVVEGRGGSLYMDYQAVPTTVFTPLEYGCVGLSEEDAIARHGKENIEVYISYLKPLEWTLNHEEHDGVPVREDNSVFVKLITDLRHDERVIGVHYLGPNAGEIIQGMAIAVRARATKADFDDTIGIHPTTAEEFTILEVTKSSGKSAQKKGC